MSYRFFYRQNLDLIYTTERHSLTRVAYLSKSSMKEQYPDGDYEVIGEIGNFAKKYSRQNVVITESGKSIPIFPLGSCKRPFEWVSGYAPVGEEVYVAVIKSIIPLWVGNFCIKIYGS